MTTPTLLQALADRIAGLPVNGHKASDFPEPLKSLWEDFDASPSEDTKTVFSRWAGTDQARIDLASEIILLAQPGTPPPPDPWKIYSLHDAYQSRLPLEYLVEDTICVPSLSIVYGSPGGLKSLLVADMVTCVAAGIDWLPSGDPKIRTARRTKQVPILWCDFDNGKRRTDERFDALGHARNLPIDTPIYYVSMPNPWLDANDSAAVEDLRSRILKLGARIVVIDNLATITGKADENSADMVPVLSNLRYLAENSNCAVIIIHHQRKANGTLARKGESLRGHGSIEAALDLALCIDREDEHADTVTVKSTKSRDVEVYPFGARFEFDHRPGTKELMNARFFGVEIDDKLSNNAVQTAIINSLRKRRPLKQTELLKEVKAILPDVGVNRIRHMIVDMVGLMLIIEMPGAHNSTLYDLPASNP